MTKKVKISFLVLVWSIVAIQMYVNYNQRINDTVTAFSVVDEDTSQEVIKGYGFLEKSSLSPRMKRKVLENLAFKLGITDGFTFSTGEGDGFNKTILTKEGRYARTILSIVTLVDEEAPDKAEQYIAVDIETAENTEKAYKLYKKIKRVYKELGVDAQISLEINAGKRGNYVSENGKGIFEDIFRLLNARRTDAIMENGICTVYGYTPKEDNYLKLGGKKVNIQIVLSYDEEKDTTLIKIGMPIVNSPY